MAQGLLGGLPDAAFLRRHWQKHPLFVRGAIADCAAWLEPEALFDWASRDDVESRLVSRVRNTWSVRHGPFRRTELRRLPERGWSLLVQGVDQFHADASRLLQQFSFIPHARLDDLMVSYAPPGGGVGPHFDSYDVFLLQGAGTRRWRISTQKDMQLIEHAPLRILKNFRPTQEWITQPGDLLYLPPRFAHEGVAIEPCITLSIGFRAPRNQDLASHFLEYLQDELKLEGIYEDRDLIPQQHPAELAPQLLRKFSRILDQVRWSESDIRKFSGRYLTEPKLQTVFQPPRRATGVAVLAKRIAARGVRLTLPTRMLFSGNDIFINGERHSMHGCERHVLVRLADRREVPAFNASAATVRLLQVWHRAGYIEI